MKEYNVIIFDLDGTISDSGVGITKCVQYALKKLNIIEEDLEKLKHFVGPPLKDELIKTYGCSEEQAKQGVEFYRERYKPIGIYETEIYPGTEEMLEMLKGNGKYIALATSKPLPMAEEVLKYLKIYSYFDKVMGAELKGPRQSKVDVLEALFDEMPDSITKKQCIMIGDTCFDIDGANTVGIDSIGVDYGFGDKDEMLAHGAKAIAYSATELCNMLLK